MPPGRGVGRAASVREALPVGDRAVVAFVGAGGKTTAMFRLAAELRAGGARVVVTTTTRILVPSASRRVVVIVARRRADALRAIRQALQERRLPVLGSAVAAGKLLGVRSAMVAALASQADVTHVLVEADGAAGRPLKAPRRREPLIPSAATIVVAVAGVDAVGRTLSRAAHHARPISALTGARPADRVDAALVARVMTDRRGGAKGVPARARLVHFVNKVDTPRRLVVGHEIARELRRGGAERVVLAACRRRRPVVAVVAGRRQARESGRAAERSSR